MSGAASKISHRADTGLHRFCCDAVEYVRLQQEEGPWLPRRRSARKGRGCCRKRMGAVEVSGISTTNMTTLVHSIFISKSRAQTPCACRALESAPSRCGSPHLQTAPVSRGAPNASDQGLGSRTACGQGSALELDEPHARAQLRPQRRRRVRIDRHDLELKATAASLPLPAARRR